MKNDNQKITWTLDPETMCLVGSFYDYFQGCRDRYRFRLQLKKGDRWYIVGDARCGGKVTEFQAYGADTEDEAKTVAEDILVALMSDNARLEINF